MDFFKRTFIFFLAGFFLCAAAHAETVQADSKISKVVVYDDRALVTRSAELQLTLGSHEVIFSGLPGSLEPDSISAKGEGQAKVKLFGARIVTQQLEDSQSPRVKELETKMESLRDKQAAQDATEKILQEKWDFLASIRAAQGTQIGKDLVTRQPMADEIQKLSLFLDQEFLSVTQKRSELQMDRRSVSKEIDQVQRELNQLQQQNVKWQQSIAVDLEAANAGGFRLEVSYRVPGASWQPVYEARTDIDSNQVELDAYGMIQQSTGEDWKDVSLELSTAKPALGGQMPEIEPWYLFKFEPPQLPLMAFAPRSKMVVDQKKEMMNEGVLGNSEDRLEEFEADKTRGRKDAPLPSSVASAQIQSSGPSVQYVLPKKETILSDGQSKKSSIQIYQFPANFVYQAVPKLSPYAYLRAKVKNNSEGLLLPGQVQVFLKGAYVGNSWIKSIGTDEEFDLFLGVDEKIRVTQKRLSRKESVSLIPGFKGKIKTVEFVFSTTIENYSGKDAAVLLQDHVPVAQHQDIKVEFSTEPSPTRTLEDKPSVFEWAFKIPAGQKQKVQVSFKVKHPEDMVVQGL